MTAKDYAPVSTARGTTAELRQADKTGLPRMGKLLEILQEDNGFCFRTRFGNRFIAIL